MTRKNKTIIIILCVINVVSLLLFSLKNNLLSSNLSRIANQSKEDYFLFILISLFYGFMLFLLFIDMQLKKYAFLSLFSLLIGGIIPYNYLDTLAISSNLHLIGGFFSIVALLILYIQILNKLNILNIKFSNFLKIGLIIVCLIFAYLYGKYGFINSLSELSYLYLIIIGVLLLNKVL